MSRINQKKIKAMSTKILKIEGRFEIWGFFLNGTLIKTRKVVIPFQNR